MAALFELIPFWAFVAALATAFGAGVIKGVVGFGMPMIIVSTTAGFLTPELAIAALLLPTLASNGYLAFRWGWTAAWQVVKDFRVFLTLGGILIVAIAQTINDIPEATFFFVLGLFVIGFSTMQLIGWLPSIAKRTIKSDVIVAVIAGVTGGLSGIWGPPTVAYLTAVNTSKDEQIRIQGVIYGLGTLALFLAHLKSGLMTGAGFSFSVAMIVPALVGSVLGLKIHDRINQVVFKRLTLIILCLAGLNLLRRGLIGQ